LMTIFKRCCNFHHPFVAAKKILDTTQGGAMDIFTVAKNTGLILLSI
jgi:hypothetical protein